MPRAALALTTTALLALAACGAPEQAPPPADPAQPAEPPTAAAPEIPGMAVYESAHDVAETSERVQEGLEEAGMVVATVDHAANAEGVGEQLRPTTLVIGGAPPAGTPIMAEQPRAGVDLPQKFLAWEAEDGTVYLGHNTAEYVGARAGIEPASPALEMLATASTQIAGTASGSEAAVSEGGEAPGSEGYLVEQESDASVEESIARYEQAFAEQDLMAVAGVDHAMGAESIGEQLAPVQVTFVGNPEVGTTLLQASQTIGIDLPVRYLAWEDETGTVRVGHPDIRELADRHGVTDADETLDMVETATSMFTDTAAGAAS